MSEPEVSRFDLYHGDGQRRPEVHEALPEHPVLFQEAGAYLADADLVEAVNVALTVGQPLLLTGEPGCGKTRLAWSITAELDLGDPSTFYTRSNSRAQDLLYTFDAVRRFYDIEVKDARATDPNNYVDYGPLGQAIVDNKRRVVLIDEIDKAPRDFPNDLLHELDRMSFEVHELDLAERQKASTVRPIVIITSNSERQLPLPFLRRCVFHHIQFPHRNKLIEIIRERLGPLDLDGTLIEAAVDRFREVREIPGITKRPATGELLTWLVALQAKDVVAATLRTTALSLLPLWQALLKDRDDFRRLQEAS